MQSAFPRRPCAIVLDDEPVLCRALTRMLEDEFDVTAYTAGGAAIADLRDGLAADVIVSGMQLSDMTAIRLHARLQGFRSELAERMIFVEGAPGADLEADRFLEEHRDRLLHQPVRREELRAAIGSVMGA